MGVKHTEGLVLLYIPFDSVDEHDSHDSLCDRMGEK